MGWVLTAVDQIVEVDRARTSAVRLGDEVSHGGAQPGILIGHGAPRAPHPRKTSSRTFQITRNWPSWYVT